MATRRDLLKSGLATGMAAVFTGGSLEAAIERDAIPAPDWTWSGGLSRSSFSGLLDERFSARGSATWFALALVLTAVRDLPQADRRGLVDSEDCFVLRFRGPARRPLAQGTYTLRHASLGAFPLFLVPMGGNGGTRVYEAVINRAPLG
jgi:hypothetical protein